MNLVALLLSMANYMIAYFGTVRSQIQTLTTRLNNHITDQSDPHNVTAAQVGLSEVPNYAPATQLQAETGVHGQSLMTPKRVDNYMEKNVYAPLTAVLDQAIKDLQ